MFLTSVIVGLMLGVDPGPVGSGDPQMPAWGSYGAAAPAASPWAAGPPPPGASTWPAGPPPPALATALPPPPPPLPVGNPPLVLPPIEPDTQSTWYARVDYLYWNEVFQGAVFDHESGVLTTVGYQRRREQERYRVELFTGNVDYFGGEYDGNNYQPLDSTTNYLGGRGEIEYLLEPDQPGQQPLHHRLGHAFLVPQRGAGLGRRLPGNLVDDLPVPGLGGPARNQPVPRIVRWAAQG